MRRLLSQKKFSYDALLNELRFLEERNQQMQDFLFLGDWQLQHPVVPSQLELAKLRFYKDKVSKRCRQKNL